MKNAFTSQEGKTTVIAYYDKILKDLSVINKQVIVPTKYGDTFALISGEEHQQTVILLHGSCMNSAMWFDDMNTLSLHYQVIALDIPGEPGKSDERQIPFDGNDYVKWLSEVLSYLKIKNTILIGNSLGGWIALKFSIAHPEYVKKVVLLAPAGIGTQNPQFAMKAMELLPKGDAGVTELFTELNGGAEIPKDRLNYQKLIASVFHNRQEVIPLFTDEELKKLSMPCMILLGKKDIMIRSQETAERAARLISHCFIKEYPEKGHALVGMEHIILRFLQEEQTMNMTIKGNRNSIAVIQSDAPIITDLQSAVDFAISISYDTGVRDLVLPKACITEDFFILSTKLAGEILQKYMNYGIRLAVVGDFSHYTSKPLHDFIYESNHGRNFFFVSGEEEAIQKLDGGTER